jgi:hypothetical protein
VTSSKKIKIKIKNIDEKYSPCGFIFYFNRRKEIPELDLGLDIYLRESKV